MFSAKRATNRAFILYQVKYPFPAELKGHFDGKLNFLNIWIYFWTLICSPGVFSISLPIAYCFDYSNLTVSLIIFRSIICLLYFFYNFSRMETFSTFETFIQIDQETLFFPPNFAPFLVHIKNLSMLSQIPKFLICCL